MGKPSGKHVGDVDVASIEGVARGARPRAQQEASGVDWVSRVSSVSGSVRAARRATAAPPAPKQMISPPDVPGFSSAAAARADSGSVA
jgi:hypothetical protein